jgi:EAL domain-containing protein (putative c-di-GMP-specific phosphodiesterase class I)
VFELGEGGAVTAASTQGQHQQRGAARRVDGVKPGLDAAAAGMGIVPVFQPIVSLPDETTVGYEALARWPNLCACTPGEVFDHADDIGNVDGLDRSCIDAAISAAVRSPLRRKALLCVNAEPSTAYVGRAGDAVLALGHDELTVMFEITERTPLAHPHSLLRKVAALRSDGFAVALDDVGAHADSLALLDVVMPDVIKLDLALVQRQPTHAQAQTLAAVLAHHERSGAVILAEGIETNEHLEQALAVGATLGQGYRFGRPRPLDRDVTAMWSPAPQAERYGAAARSPFELVAGTSPVRTVRKQTLIEFSRHIESHATHAVDAPMVFTALQRDEYFTDTTRDRYRKLGVSCPLVAVFGRDMPTDLGPGVRGVMLHSSDPLCSEWTVVVLGPHYAAAIIAREHADAPDVVRHDDDRRFDFVITYDRMLVTAAARNLLDRIP